MLKTLSFHGGKISYKISGSGPALVFLHGFLLHSGIWEEFTTYFDKHYTVICPDLPGHGGSGLQETKLSMELMAEAVHAILDAENCRKASVIGHSMGGYVALALLNKYPQNLVGLVLLNTYPWSDSTDKSHSRERILTLLRKGKRDLFIGEVFKSLFQSSSCDLSVYRKKAVQMADLLDSTVISTITRAMGNRTDQSSSLLQSNIPYVWITGTQDSQNKFEEILKKADQINMPRPELVDLGHMSFLEDPGRMAELLQVFLQIKANSGS